MKYTRCHQPRTRTWAGAREHAVTTQDNETERAQAEADARRCDQIAVQRLVDHDAELEAALADDWMKAQP
jgi:hypothetical protein